MKTKNLTIALVLLLLAGGLILGFLLSQGAPGPVQVPTGEEALNTPASKPARPAIPKVQKGTRTKAPGKTSGERTQVGTLRQRNIKHGIRGVVLGPNGGPVPGAKVFLAEPFNVGNFIAAIARSGNASPRRRFNLTRTDKTGAFVIGFDPNVNADLFIVHPGFQKYMRKSVHIPADTIADLGRIVLSQGLVVRGYVRAAATGLPIQGATVRRARTSTAVFDSVPGEEDGEDHFTDRNGYYEFTTLKPGTYKFEAFAKGFAKEVKNQVNVTEGGGPIQIDFSLKVGLTISGIVVDGEGKPVADAKVTANSYSVQSPVSSDTRSAKDGTFEILGLPAGKYNLTAQAPGFVEGKKPLAQAGDTKVAIVLQRQGGVEIQVLGRHNRPLRSYHLELRQVFEGQKVYGKTTVPEVDVRNARQGRYVLTGIDPGKTYCLRVEARGYAMTFSQPFKVELGKPMPFVVVRLTQGGSIHGRVVDSTGKPVAGALVETMSNDYQDNAFIRMFAPLIPQQHSRVKATTNKNGEYFLRLVMPQTYQLKVTHPEYPTTYRKDIQVAEGQTVQVPDIILPVGVVVYGVAYDPNGQPIKGGKVTMQGDQGIQFGAEAVTDDQGRFQFPPAPPGTYKLQCSRPVGNNPFMTIVDFKKSETPITISGTQKRLRVNLQIKP